MTCPYPDTSCAPQAVDGESCMSCGRFIKSCPQCKGSNRAFANHCRSCGTALETSNGNWLAYKGSARRLGFNASRNGRSHSSFNTSVTELKLRLGDACWSLLGYDRHLIAMSRNGTVEIADPQRPDAPHVRFQATGPVTCQPCIAGGVLYVGSPKQIAAYSLGAMTLASPQFRPLWQVPLPGNPIQALTAAGNNLYATIASSEKSRDVVAIEIGDRAPSTVRTIHTSRQVSWIAGDPADARIVFFSEENDGMSLHTVGAQRTETHLLSLRELAEHPIALVGGKVFAIFGSERRLHQIDAHTGAVDEVLHEDVQMFALTQDGGAWGRDGVNIHNSGVRFTLSNTHDSFAALDRAVKGSPVIVQGRAAIVGMSDGRVRIYELKRAPAYGIWPLDAGSGSTITALASFDRYVAAGNADGIVEVLELQSKAAGG